MDFHNYGLLIFTIMDYSQYKKSIIMKLIYTLILYFKTSCFTIMDLFLIKYSKIHNYETLSIIMKLIYYLILHFVK